MRLYNEKEQTTKLVEIEEFATFNNLLGSNKLFIGLILYTAMIVICAVLTFLDGGYILGAVDVVCHAAICAALWMFHMANKTMDEKFSTKGIKLFQIGHAVKYVVLFAFFFIMLIMVILGWIGAAKEAKEVLVSAKQQVNQSIIDAAKHDRNAVFWSYLGILISYLVFVVVVLVYYKAVMTIADATEKYNEKGTRFWNDIKFGAIYCFITAGLLVVLGLLCATGFMGKVLAKVGKTNFALFTGGLGWLSFIGRVLFAGVLVYIGILLLNGFKLLNNTKTFHLAEVSIDDGSIVRDNVEESETESAEEVQPGNEEEPTEEAQSEDEESAEEAQPEVEKSAE